MSKEITIKSEEYVYLKACAIYCQKNKVDADELLKVLTEHTLNKVKENE